MGDNILGPGNIIGVQDGPADGDLMGNYPGPRVRSLQSVILSGTPGVGYSLVSTSPTAAHWIMNLQPVATITSGANLVVNTLTPVDATVGALIVNLPPGQVRGSLIAAKKVDATANSVSVSGSIEGASHTVELTYQNDTILFVADENGSWWPLASYRTLTGLDSRYVGVVRTVSEVANSGTASTVPDPTASSVTNVVLTANCTLTFPSLKVGKEFRLVLTQDNIGSRIVTWPGTIKWPGGSAPTLTTSAGASDQFSFLSIDGTHWLASVIGLNLH